MKSKIFTKNATKASDLPEDEEDSSWLDEPADVYPAARVLHAEESSPINISASLYLKTFLSDEKPEFEPENRSCLKASDGVVQHDDNDFSMNFD